MYIISLLLFVSLWCQSSYSTFASKTIIDIPYALQRLGNLDNDQAIVSYDEALKRVTYGKISNKAFISVEQVYKVICDDESSFTTTPDQQCMLYGSHQWCKVKHLVLGDRLLCRDGNFVTIAAIKHIKKNTQLCQIEVAPHHTFFVTRRGILVHNSEVAVATGAVVVLATVAPPLIPVITVVKCVSLVGLFGAAVWQLLSKKKNRDIKQKYTQDASPFTASSPPPPKKPDDEDEFKRHHPHGRYEDASYHKNHQSGRKSPRPIDGQAALDNSFAIEDTNSARVGVSNKQVVILRLTRPGLYHGYVAQWNDTSVAEAIKVLIKKGILNRRGKFLT